jgi:ABC-type polysaccharide/polyol phosphate export permease
VLRVWLYASPVLYFAHEVPDRYKPLLEINPIGSLLTAWSDCLNAGHTPALSDMLIGLAWGVVLFVAGALFFLSRERDFAVRL